MTTRYLQTTRAGAEGLDPVILLGPWCVSDERADRQTVIDGSGAFGDDPLSHESRKASLYRMALSVVAESLNGAHGIDRPERYWEVILYRFLTMFIQDFYVRYMLLHEALRKEPDLVVLATEASPDLVPESDRQMAAWMKSSDAFNLKIFTEIAAFLKAPRHMTALTAFPDPVARGSGRPPVRRRLHAFGRSMERLLSAFWTMAAAARAPGGGSILFLPTHFTPRAIYRLSKRLGVGIRVVSIDPPMVRRRGIEPDRRQRLWVRRGGSEMEQCLLALLSRSLPRDYLEDYGDHQASAQCMPADPPPSLVVAAYLPDVASRIWLAERRLKGTKAIMIQHGGNYGESVIAPWERVEMSMADAFVTWGWRSGNAVPLPSPRLQPFRNFTGEGRRLLIVQREVTLYPDWTGLLPRPVAPAGAAAILEGLPEGVRRSTTVRIRLNKQARREAQIDALARYPSIRIDEGALPIGHALRQARLVVIDYLFSTTFLECLTANIPTIVLAGEDLAWIRADALPLYRALLDQGVILQDPRAVAGVMASIWNDPGRWWCERERAAAVDRFRRNFAWTEDEARTLDLWCAFLEKHLRGIPVTTVAGREERRLPDRSP